jgi:alanyl-tRNA synthetase
MADRVWSAAEVRRTFIDFFVGKGHTFVPSSSVIPHNDPTLLFANSGMNQFKSIFLCTVDPSSDFAKLKRAANSQKCIRAGGKHNDLDDVGKDNYHHTFFEMLGNWSFGDYFKEEAIAWAWELLVDVYRLDKDRLYVTYFEGNEQYNLKPDFETKNLWEKYLSPNRILPGSMKDNFWEMGDVGPCGPCTEIHYDRIGGRDAAALVNRDDPTVLEVWNLVFMQFERKSQGVLVPLPANHVDTGMGLERLTSILQNKMSNYDIDLFQDIFVGVERTTKSRPYEGRMGAADVDLHDTAFRVIADHIRMLSMAIADGQKPGPEGTGYVLRRVVRRAVRFGTEVLSAPPGFLHQLVPYVVQTLGTHYPTLSTHADDISRSLKYEEQLFVRTLQNGLRKFNNIVRHMEREGRGVFEPTDAAHLFTTFGFPTDLTRIKVEEKRLVLNEGAVQELLDMEKKKSEDARKVKMASDASSVHMDPDAIAHLSTVMAAPVTNDQYKYEQEDITARVVALYKAGTFPDRVTSSDGVVGVFLDKTNFYAESGGQHYDQGVITKHGQDGVVTVEVENVQSFGGYVYHSGAITEGLSLSVGDTVDLSVNMQRRQPIAANHTCTHVLNLALRHVVGDHCEQKGSLVLQNRFRFDYKHNAPLTSSELSAIQKKVNDVIEQDLAVHVAVVPLEEAKRIFGVRCLFDEQYPNPVRVVSVGVDVERLLRDPDNKEWYDTAVEFCGGTHLNSTSEIANFVIIGEEALAAGVRRITALTGAEAVEAVNNKEEFQLRLSAAKNLQRDDLSFALKTLREDLDRANLPADARIEFRAQLDALAKVVAKDVKAKQSEASDAAVEYADRAIVELKASGSHFVCDVVPSLHGKNVVMTNAIKRITQDHPDVSVLLISVDDTNNDPKKHKVTIVAHVPEAVVAKGFQADEWAKVAAAEVGGKGGGRATTAQGSGGNVGGVDSARQAAASYARERVK